MNKVLYAKAKEYADTNTKGSKLELKCLAEMLYEFTDSQIADLQKKYKLLGERCNQLLKNKGNLTDELQELKETFAQTIENDEVTYETLKLHDQEEIGMLNSKVTELENKIADIKANCDLAIEGRDVKIMELKQQIEKMKCCSNCNNEGDYKEPYRYGTGWCNICKRHKIAKGSFDKWEIKENE